MRVPRREAVAVLCDTILYPRVPLSTPAAGIFDLSPCYTHALSVSPGLSLTHKHALSLAHTHTHTPRLARCTWICATLSATSRATWRSVARSILWTLAPVAPPTATASAIPTAAAVRGALVCPTLRAPRRPPLPRRQQRPCSRGPPPVRTGGSPALGRMVEPHFANPLREARSQQPR